MAKKTPGVYVEEKSIFPPSVAEVETAIPAFIGYTEKATEKNPNDLLNKPKKIVSMLEYRQFFGGPPPLNIKSVILDENNVLSDADINPQYFMFDSLQQFFFNGGGKCYIVCVGLYKDGKVFLGDRSSPNDKPGFDVGLAALEKYDEPTMILFPDAVLLSEGELYGTLQPNTLRQCFDLKDRFAIFDLKEKNTPDRDWENQKTEFRNRIGTTNLKYGAAYTPHLRIMQKKNIRFRDIHSRITRGGIQIELESLAKEKEIEDFITEFKTVVTDCDTIEKAPKDFLTTYFKALPNPPTTIPDTLKQGFQTLEARFGNAPDVPGKHVVYNEIFAFLYKILIVFDDYLFTTPVTSKDILAFVDAKKDTAKTFLKKMIALDRGAESFWKDTYKQYSKYKDNFAVANWEIDLGDDTKLPAPDAAVFTGADDNEKFKKGMNALNQLLFQINTLMIAIKQESEAIENNMNSKLYEMFPLFKSLIDDLNQILTTIPPSGAIAGVYSRVDATRGVWKAPANVSLSGVEALTVTFRESDTDDLNVHPTGKSINAIKFMTGYGNMVWGARTLAGNDNEWKYIPVRRFYNMVEESVKKATFWAVFEPNDANTWVKVKGMIENFLTLQWRKGALQGATPEDAFFVKVGLGQTMTGIDILEGRMLVEIGMAVVRPAEFIILTFSHKMAQS